MLKRIVRMEFEPDKVEEFLLLFDGVKDRIRASEGCTHLELCQDAANNCVYYTFSIWKDEKDLDRYRHSELFADTWARTKVLFGGKPLAYSLLEA